MRRRRLFNGRSGRIAHEQLLSGDANAFAAVLGVDFRNVGLQPRTIAVELLALPLRSCQFIGIVNFFHFNAS